MAPITWRQADLQERGPLIEVTVAITRAAAAVMTAAGVSVPAAIPVTAMVDTGSRGSVIKRGIAQQLGIRSCRVITLSTGSVPVEAPGYAVRLILASAFNLETVVAELSLDNHPGVDALIGRDFLSHGVLTYTGCSGEFTLAF